MKHVKRYVDRRGALRLYFRKRGHPRDGEPLSSPWPDVPAGSALEAEVTAILGVEIRRPRPSTLAGAIRAYELSPDFRGLAAGTRYIYQLFMKELEGDGYGALPIGGFTPARIQDLRQVWSTRGHRAANLRLQLLKNVLEPQFVAAGLADPFARIPPVRRPHGLEEPNRIWPEAVVIAVVGAALEAQWYGVARAVVIARYAAARRGDLIRISDKARAQGRIAWLSGKKRVPVNMPEDPLLTRWLAAIPDRQPLTPYQLRRRRAATHGRPGHNIIDLAGLPLLEPGTLVFNLKNRRYSESGLGQQLAEIVTALHLKGLIDSPDYGLHGLRHTFGVEAALAGCTDAQGAALMGHSSASSFAIYRRQAARLTLSDAGAALIQSLRLRQATDPTRTPAEQQVSNAGLIVSNAPAAPAEVHTLNPNPRKA